MKLLNIFWILILLIPIASALVADQETKYNPSVSNATYNLTLNVNGLNNITVNSTCLIMQGNTSYDEYCTIYTSPITINLPIDQDAELNFFNEAPPNGTITNTTILMNFSLSNTVNLTDCNITVNDIFRLNRSNLVNDTQYNFTLNESWMIAGNNIINITCLHNFSNSNLNDSKIIIYDIITPNIVINPLSTFKENNQSNLDQYTGDIFLVNVTFTDETNLFASQFNMTFKGVEVQSYTNISLDLISYTMEQSFNVSDFSPGVYNIELSASDGHTKNKIKDYEVNTFINELDFLTEEKNNIKIKAIGSYKSKFTKHIDKYSYEFDYFTKKKARTFIIESDNDIFYIADSKYKAHFVIFNSKTQEGNWLDFDGLEGDYKVKFKNKNYVEVTFNNIQDERKLEINSLGGLNTIKQNYKWYKGNYSTDFKTLALTNSEQQFNLTLNTNSSFIKNSKIDLFYDGVLQTDIKVINITNTLFLTNYVTLNQTGLKDINITVNITQFDDTTYEFKITEQQNITDSSLFVRFIDENSQLIIRENITVIFETATETTTTITDTGNITFPTLRSGETKVSTFNDNYPISSLFINIINESQSVDFFMLNDTLETLDVVYFVQDRGQNPVENALMTFSRRFNSTFKVVAQDRTDSLGLAEFHLDRRIKYSLVIEALDFPVNTLTIDPILDSATITLDKETTTLYNNSLNGITYSISPQNTQINISNNSIEFKLAITDTEIGLVNFGLQIINSSFICVPSNCITNVSNVPAGGAAIVTVIPNGTGRIEVNTFYTRIGESFNNLQTINHNVFIPIDTEFSLLRVLTGVREELNGKAIISVVAAIIQSIAVLIASQFGIIGLAALWILGITDIILISTGFLEPLIGLITIISSIGIYVFLKNDNIGT